VSNAITTFANLRVGTPDVEPSAPSHVPGIHQGNALGSFERDPGFTKDEHGRIRATPRRSTGIAADDRAPIDPRMPFLSPA
jgi:hypothetical protein